MLPVALDAALLKLRLPDLVLRPGMEVVARVASRGEGTRGAIVLAGTLLSAQLPEHVREGETLRLTVAETSPERIVLRLDAQLPPAGAVPPPPAPPRSEHRLEEDGSRGAVGGRGGAAVALSYETPALGRLDLRLHRGPEGVSVVVTAPAGSAGLAQDGAEALRSALEAKLGTAASVRVDVRREPFDAYA